MCKYCSDPKKASGNGHVAAMLYGMEKKASGRESVAPDKDTPERKLQQKINMLGNLYMSGLAMSDTQAGGKVLDNESEYSSHMFWNVYIEPLLKWQRKYHLTSQLQPIPENTIHEHSDDDIEDELDLFDDTDELHCGTEVDTSFISKDKDGRKKVKGVPHQVINYVYRGKYLANMSPLEYAATVVIKKGSVKSYTGGAGRQGRVKFEFDSRHPQAKHYKLFLNVAA